MLLYIHLKYDIFLYQLFVVFSLSLPFLHRAQPDGCVLCINRHLTIFMLSEKKLLHNKGDIIAFDKTKENCCY